MDIKKSRILYMGTPEISAFVLKSLLMSGFNIIGVIAQEDKPVGRKKILEAVPTKKIAQEFNIPVYQPHKIRKEYEFVKEIKPDLILTLAYGQIIPQGLLEIPKYGCLNLHGSLLPKYRGAAPIQYALFNGEKETGISLMEMTDQMDAGKVYAVKKVEISEDDNSTSLFRKMAIAAKDVCFENLQKYLDGNLPGVEQDTNLVTFCPTIKPEEEKLSLDLSINDFVNRVRGLSEEPGGYVFLDNEKFKIYKAKVVSNDIKGKMGEIVLANKSGLYLQLKNGIVSLEIVQKSGKNKMDFKSFVNGNQNILGKVVS